MAIHVLVTYIDQSQELYAIEEVNDLVLTSAPCLSMKAVKTNEKKEKEELTVVIPWHQIHSVVVGETVDL